jgi:hypothetical protein
MTQTQEQTTVPSIAVNFDSEDFHTGLVEGMTGVSESCRYKVSCPVTEEDIVGVLRNLTGIAVEGWLSEAQLRHDAGWIAGILLRPVPPPPSQG